MANKIAGYYKELPSWSKGIVAIGGIGIAFYIGYTLIRRIKEQAKQKELEKGVIDATNELNDLAKKGMLPTISKSQADGFADKIVKQFKGADLLLESYPTVLNVFKSLKNNADFLLLKRQFGLRTYDDAFWGQVKNVTLEGAIQDELMSSSIVKLNEQLRKQNITYQV